MENTSKFKVANNRLIGNRSTISERAHKLPEVKAPGKRRDNRRSDIELDKDGAEGLGDDLEHNIQPYITRSPANTLLPNFGGIGYGRERYAPRR